MTAAARCPGETACDRFRRAGGANDEEKRANACTGCALLHTKPSITTDLDDEVVTRIERIARLRDTGSRDVLDDVTSLEFELLCVWDDSVATRERMYKAQMLRMWEALVTRAASGL